MLANTKKMNKKTNYSYNASEIEDIKSQKYFLFSFFFKTKKEISTLAELMSCFVILVMKS